MFPFGETGHIERQFRDYHVGLGGHFSEVHDYQQRLPVGISYECILLVRVESVVAEIQLHEVEKRSLADGLPLVAEPENPCI